MIEKNFWTSEILYTSLNRLMITEVMLVTVSHNISSEADLSNFVGSRDLLHCNSVYNNFQGTSQTDCVKGLWYSLTAINSRH